MKKLAFFTIALILMVATATAQDGQILKKNFTIQKGVPTLRLIGTTPILNFGTIGGKIDWYNAGVSDVTLTHSANTLTLAGGNLVLPAPPLVGTINMAKIYTVTKTIGAIGVAGCDFNFATAANTTQQVIDLGSIVPARARVIDVIMQTDVTWAGTSITAFTCEAGNASSGNQFFADTDIITAGLIAQTAVGAGFTLVAVNAAATKVYIGGAPTGGNWSALLAGKATVYVTYIVY